MKKIAIAKTLVFSILVALIPLAPAQAASLTWPFFDTDPGNQWAGEGQQTNTSTVYSTFDSQGNLAQPLESANMQFYGFENPLSGNAASKTQGPNGSVGFTDGTFQFTVSAIVAGQDLAIAPASVSATWFPAQGNIQAHLLIFVDDLPNPTSIELLFQFGAGSLTTGSSTNGRRIALMGDTTSADYYVGMKYYYQVSGNGSNQTSVTPAAPAKYSGPEFSGLSGMRIMSGSTGKLEGKRLDQISSIEIGGKTATFTATSATELSLAVPAGLAPGVYDLVINSTAGKLTQIGAIVVREPLKAFSFTSRTSGKVTEEKFREHAIVATIQEPELNKARCVVNAKSLAAAKAQAQRLCALIKGANSNIVTTVIDARSTVKNDSVFARVIYGWN